MITLKKELESLSEFSDGTTSRRITEFIDTNETDLDGDELIIHNANGFGATAVTIQGTEGITWKQVDILIEALKHAKLEWQPNDGE